MLDDLFTVAKVPEASFIHSFIFYFLSIIQIE